MLVQEVLKSKGGGGVVTVAPTASIAEAAKILSAKGIGTVVVAGDGAGPDGILSERDIVRELAKGGSGCLNDPVSRYMTRNVKTCTPQSSIEDVLQAMTKGRFRHMPILDNGSMVGLISLGDVVKAQLAHLAMEKDALEGMIMGH